MYLEYVVFIKLISDDLTWIIIDLIMKTLLLKYVYWISYVGFARRICINKFYVYTIIFFIIGCYSEGRIDVNHISTKKIQVVVLWRNVLQNVTCCHE